MKYGAIAVFGAQASLPAAIPYNQAFHQVARQIKAAYTSGYSTMGI